MPTAAQATLLALVRRRGPGTLAGVLGRLPTVGEVEAALRLWEMGLVARDAKGVYAALPQVEGPADTRKYPQGAPAVLFRFVSTATCPAPGVRRRGDPRGGGRSGGGVRQDEGQRN